jgi:uncharacterized membrane protein YhaH (DUF805 family)
MDYIKRLYSGRIDSLAYLIGSIISWGGFWLQGKVLEIISRNTFINVLSILISLLLFIFFFSVLTRRLHDLNKSGWLSLLAFVPLANAVMGIILLFKSGTHEANKFGAQPQGGKFIVKELFALQA